MKNSILLLIVFCFSCGADFSDGGDPKRSSEAPSREEIAERSAKADSNIDHCAIYDWYGDGVCDSFCSRPDEDCEESSQCEKICEAEKPEGSCLTTEECINACESDDLHSEKTQAYRVCIEASFMCYRLLSDCVEVESNRQRCQSYCSVLENNQGCFSEQDCMSECGANVEKWDRDEVSDFTTCLAQPLCYQSASQCTQGRRLERECAQACEGRGDSNGACTGEKGCLEYCWMHSGEWKEGQEKAFKTCASENPLCYQTMDQCVEGRR